MNELLASYLPLVIFIGVAMVIGLALLVAPFVIAAPVHAQATGDHSNSAYALLGVACAYLGFLVFQKLNVEQFRRLVNLALIVSGIALALK